MTTWYRDGVVGLTNGSKNVTGVGTDWVNYVLPGGIFFTPTGLYEVETVSTATSLQLVTPYTGPTASNLGYAIAPTQGYLVELSERLGLVLRDYGSLKDAWTDGTLLAAAVKAVDLLAADGGAKVGVKQPETGAVLRTALDTARDFQVSDDYSTLQAGLNAKRNLASSLRIAPKQHVISGTLSMSKYLNVHGVGDASQLKLTTGAGLVYQDQIGTFDDHPHKTLSDFRVSGDGTFQTFPGTQNGSTIGFSNAMHASFLEMRGMTFELHDIGRLLKDNYTSIGYYNHYRANKVGLKLEGVTSYREIGSYFRYHSTAALLITGHAETITIEGGAIEGNPGRGIWMTGLTAGLPCTLTLDDVYAEGNGDRDNGIPAIDIEESPDISVLVRGGSFTQNITLGRVNGEFRWGSRVVLAGAGLGGYHVVREVAIESSCAVATDLRFNTELTAADAIARTPKEPAFLRAFSTRPMRSMQFGLTFQVTLSGKANRSSPLGNLAAAAYPHVTDKAASVTVTQNAAANYGDGSWTDVALPGGGDFNNNYASLQTFVDPSSINPLRLTTFLLTPAADVDIGFVSSGGAQNLAAFFRLKAGVTYKMLTLSTRTGAGSTVLRMFSLGASPPVIRFMPHYATMTSDHRVFAALANAAALGML